MSLDVCGKFARNEMPKNYCLANLLPANPKIFIASISYALFSANQLLLNCSSGTYQFKNNDGASHIRQIRHEN